MDSNNTENNSVENNNVENITTENSTTENTTTENIEVTLENTESNKPVKKNLLQRIFSFRLCSSL